MQTIHFSNPDFKSKFLMVLQERSKQMRADFIEKQVEAFRHELAARLALIEVDFFETRLDIGHVTEHRIVVKDGGAE